MDFILNGQQQNAVILAVEWWEKMFKLVFEISGPAGSGKTSIVHELVAKIGLKHDEVLFMALVGKATMELSRRGNNAKTIHSTIYELIEVPKIDEDGNEIIRNGRVITKTVFKKRVKISDNIKLLVIDEGGMINEDMGLDIESFGVPILVLGDLNQLPPVIGNPRYLKNPDVILTEIMRQEKDSPIIKLSQMALNGEYMATGDYGSDCKIIRREDLTDEMLLSHETVIVGKNSTREDITRYIRKNLMKIDTIYPQIGEKLICRKNNWKTVLGNIPLINGLVGYVEDLHIHTYNKRSLAIDFRPDFIDDDAFEELPIDMEYLNLNHIEKKNYRFAKANLFEFAYAITCHLSQGSQYESVLVYYEPMGSISYRRKWLYTAITRAKKSITIVI